MTVCKHFFSPTYITGEIFSSKNKIKQCAVPRLKSHPGKLGFEALKEFYDLCKTKETFKNRDQRS